MNSVKIFFVLFLYPALAALAHDAETVIKQAQRCADAQIAKDYAAVVAMTHPALIKAAGGAGSLRRALEESMKEVAAAGISFEKTVIHSAEPPRRIGTALVSLAIQEVTLKTSDGRLKQESTLVAYSFDEGKKWLFADTAEMDEPAFFRFFPELKGKISLPAKKDLVAFDNNVELAKGGLSQGNEDGLNAAQGLFKRYVQLEEAFDPSIAELYADDAVIKNTRRFKDGTARTMELSGSAYKKLIRQAMSAAKERKDSNKYSDISHKSEGDKIRITATRYSTLKAYSSPVSLLLALKGAEWLIVEETSESRP